MDGRRDDRLQGGGVGGSPKKIWRSCVSDGRIILFGLSTGRTETMAAPASGSLTLARGMVVCPPLRVDYVDNIMIINVLHTSLGRGLSETAENTFVNKNILRYHGDTEYVV